MVERTMESGSTGRRLLASVDHANLVAGSARIWRRSVFKLDACVALVVRALRWFTCCVSLDSHEEPMACTCRARHLYSATRMVAFVQPVHYVAHGFQRG